MVFRASLSSLKHPIGSVMLDNVSLYEDANKTNSPVFQIGSANSWRYYISSANRNGYTVVEQRTGEGSCIVHSGKRKIACAHI
jgi:hypothetical protein